MDDLSRPDDTLTQALGDIRFTNRFLGGYAATDRCLDPLFDRHNHLRILDLACGGGDYLSRLVRRGSTFGCTVEMVGLDSNPTAVQYARTYVDRELPPSFRSRIQVTTEDALSMSYSTNAFDIVHTALFLHHLRDADAARLLREMNRIGRLGLVVNDLHRHILAYIGIWLVTRLTGMASMVQHDAPISVRRGFSKAELLEIAREAELSDPKIGWHWAFRWTLSTV